MFSSFIIWASLILLVALILTTYFLRQNRFVRILIHGIVAGLLLVTACYEMYFGVTNKKILFIIVGFVILITALTSSWKYYCEARVKKPDSSNDNKRI